MMIVAARLQNVSRRYGDTLALDQLSLEVHEGEILALLGPNGAGKTTAVRMLLGIGHPSSGSAAIRGLHPRIARRRGFVAVVLQSANVPETLRVVEHVELFRSYYPRPRPLEEVLDVSGLRGLERKMFGSLSGGQKQRVLFALAIAGDADVVLLDEPTVGLDIGMRRELWGQMSLLTSRGTAVLLTTHDLYEAETLADRIVVLSNGRKIAEGSPAEIAARVCEKTIRCRTAVPCSEISQLPGVVTIRDSDNGIEIGTSEAEATLRSLLALDPDLDDLEVRRADLEEAFLMITERRGAA